MAVETDVAVKADLDAIDEAFAAQWAVFGLGPRGTYHNEGDLVWIEAPIPQLPYNAILRSRLEADDADERLAALAAYFCDRGHEMMCPVLPLARPADLGERLAALGLSIVERATGMALDISDRAELPPPPAEADGVVYREVTDQAGMDAYEELIAYYWELPEDSRRYVYGINRWAGHGADAPGVRWVGYLDGEPVGKAFLSLRGRPDAAGIFGVSVKKEARGRAVASVLTEHLLRRAVELGRTRAVLHSSEMAVNLYRRLGFVERCAIPVYATTNLHTLQTS